MNTIGRKIVHAAVAIGAIATLALSTATTATAATPRNGVCEDGELCLYYLSNYGGSVSDFTTSVANYGTAQPSCYDFKGPGAGQGECVKNNARSVWNRRPGAAVIFFNSYYGGASDVVAGYGYRNLDVTYDNNASHRVG